MRTASPWLAAVCRQSSGCRLPFLYRLLRWSVMSVYIGNCSLSVVRGKNLYMESSIHRFPGRGRRQWMFLEPLYMQCGAGTWLWAQTLLSAITESQGSGMGWYRRIAPVSRTIMSTEQLGVFTWRPVTPVLLTFLHSVSVDAASPCWVCASGQVGSSSLCQAGDPAVGSSSSRWFAT